MQKELIHLNSGDSASTMVGLVLCFSSLTGFWPAYTMRGIPTVSGICLLVGLGILGWGLFFIFVRGGLEVDHETKTLRFWRKLGPFGKETATPLAQLSSVRLHLSAQRDEHNRAIQRFYTVSVGELWSEGFQTEEPALALAEHLAGKLELPIKNELPA